MFTFYQISLKEFILNLGFELSSNCYSYFENKSDYFENDFQQIENIKKGQFKYLTGSNSELFSFVKISGKVMDICEDNCCFEVNCNQCKYDLNSSHNSDKGISETVEYVHYYF